MGRASGRLARHGPFGHLYLHTIMMVLTSVASTSFVILLIFSLPACLHHRVTPFSADGVGAGASLPIFVPHQPRHRLAGISHHARTIVFVVVGRPVRLPGLRPVLPLQPATPTHGRTREPTDARRTGYGASRSCSWPFSMCAVEEDMVAPVTLRLS
jgi:hypothetical protein